MPMYYIKDTFIQKGIKSLAYLQVKDTWKSFSHLLCIDVRNRSWLSSQFSEHLGDFLISWIFEYISSPMSDLRLLQLMWTTPYLPVIEGPLIRFNRNQHNCLLCFRNRCKAEKLCKFLVDVQSLPTHMETNYLIQWFQGCHQGNQINWY